MMELFQTSSFSLLCPGPTWPKEGTSPVVIITRSGFTEPLNFGWKLRRRCFLRIVDMCLGLDLGRITAWSGSIDRIEAIPSVVTVIPCTRSNSVFVV